MSSVNSITYLICGFSFRTTLNNTTPLQLPLPTYHCTSINPRHHPRWTNQTLPKSQLSNNHSASQRRHKLISSLPPPSHLSPPQTHPHLSHSALMPHSSGSPPPPHPFPSSGTLRASGSQPLATNHPKMACGLQPAARRSQCLKN